MKEIGNNKHRDNRLTNIRHREFSTRWQDEKFVELEELEIQHFAEEERV